jgi:hypothetical protein
MLRTPDGPCHGHTLPVSQRSRSFRLPTAGLVVLWGVACVEVDLREFVPAGDGSLLCEAAGPPKAGAPQAFIDALHPCCEGEARWVPPDLVPEKDRDRLRADPGTGQLCVPIPMLVEPNHTPKTCNSIFDLPGACMSRCVKGVELVSTQDICANGEVCAPCYDPRTGEPTGACERGELACSPQPPIDECAVFEPEPSLLDKFTVTCCDGRGRCATEADVTAEQQALLATCPDPGTYCVPNEMVAAAGHFEAKRCRGLGGREGRCMSTCIPQVAEMADMLERDVCADGSLCAPCYDPLDGGDTGSCSNAPCDAPTDPERPFEQCGMLGPDALCVPENLVPEDQRERFDNKGCGSGCQESGTLCVPRVIIDAGPDFSPPACTTDGNEGRCLSYCIPDVNSAPLGIEFQQETCAETEKCVPCTIVIIIPISTGACDQ